MTPVARTPSPARTCWTRDRGSSRTALPHFLSPGVFGRRQGCDLASDALCRNRHRPARFPALAERRPPDPPSPPPRQRLRLHRTRAPSIGGDPSFTSLLSRDPLARGLLPRGFRGLPSDFCNRMRSASTTANRPNPDATFGQHRVAPSLAGHASRGSSNQGSSARLSPGWTPPSRSGLENQADHGGRGDPNSYRLGHLLSQIRELHAGEACNPARPSGRALYEPAGAPADTGFRRRLPEPGRACFREARAT